MDQHRFCPPSIPPRFDAPDDLAAPMQPSGVGLIWRTATRRGAGAPGALSDVPDHEGKAMDNAANSLMTALIDAGNIDTVYRDVYLDRARTLLAPVLSLEEFHRLEQQRAALAELPATIAHALETANWSLVKELSQRAQTLKHTIDDKARAAPDRAERVRRPGRSARPVFARSPIVHADRRRASSPRSGRERWNSSGRSSGRTVPGTTSTELAGAHSRHGRRQRRTCCNPMPRPRRRRTRWRPPDKP